MTIDGVEYPILAHMTPAEAKEEAAAIADIKAAAWDHPRPVVVVRDVR